MPIRRAVMIFAMTCMAHAPGQAETPAGKVLAEGITLDLGSEWTVRETVNSAMKSPMVQTLLDDAREYRLRKGDTGILISYMGFKTGPDADPAAFDAVSIVKQGAGQYLPQARETEVAVQQVTNGNVVATFTTLHARDGETFGVGIGYSGSCVTAGNLRHADKLAIFAVSISSRTCDDASHKEAVAAVLGAHD